MRKKQLSVKIKVDNVQFNYVTVAEPKAISANAKPKFSVVCVLPEASKGFKALQAATKKVWEDAFGEDSWDYEDQDIYTSQPLKTSTGYLKRGRKRLVPEGSELAYFSTSTLYNESRPNQGRPPVIDSKLHSLDPSEIYSGCSGNVLVTVKAYDNESRGVSYYLGGLQVTKQGVRLDSGVDLEKDFNVVADGFTKDASVFEGSEYLSVVADEEDV